MVFLMKIKRVLVVDVVNSASMAYLTSYQAEVLGARQASEYDVVGRILLLPFVGTPPSGGFFHAVNSRLKFIRR